MSAIRLPKLNLVGIQVSKQVSQKLSRNPKIPHMLLPKTRAPPTPTGWTKTKMPRFLIRYQTVIIVMCAMVVVFLLL